MRLDAMRQPASAAAGRVLANLADGTLLGALSLLVPATLLLGLAGLPLGPVTLAPLWAAALIAAGRFLAEPRPAVLPADGGAEGRAWALFSRLVLAAAVLAWAWKVLAIPLWSWDHFAIWGVKARRLLAAGHLDLSFLHRLELHDSRPDYPLGLPLLWRLLVLGAVPGAHVVKACHLACGLGVLAVLRRGARLGGATEPTTNAFAAWAALLPLFWDSEAVGLAEMPLALWATAAASLLFRAEPRRRDLALAAVLLGFLPWLKDEGLPLALLLALAGWLGLPPAQRRPWLRCAAGRGLPLALLALGLDGRLLPSGVGFFAWRPVDRLAERLPQAGTILAEAGRHLLAPGQLALWPTLLAASLWALLWRRRAAALLGWAVLLQLGLYVGTALVAYLPPADHLRASLGRISGGLAPLALLAFALLARRQPSPPPEDC